MKTHAAARPQQGGQIISIQVLRALAALSVAFGHAQGDVQPVAVRAGVAFSTLDVLPWGAGVDLFFVISGFIMVYASACLFEAPGGAARFLERRLKRIVPLYWLMTLAFLLVAYGFGRQAAETPLTLPALISSLTFWPFDTYGDGAPRPYFALGWTLNYEMFFYLVFAVFIGLPARKAVLGVTLALGSLTVLGAFMPQAPAPLLFWSQPIVLTFVFGMGIALLYMRGLRLPRAASWGLAALGLAAFFKDPAGVASRAVGGIVPNDALHLVAWGLPAAIIVGALVLMRENAPQPVAPAVTRFWVWLGDASYALYLVHPFVVVGVRKIWLAAGLGERLGLWPLVAAMIVASVAAALLVHEAIEKPITSALTRKRLAPV